MIGVFKKILVSGAVVSTCLSGCCVWGVKELVQGEESGDYARMYGAKSEKATVTAQGKCTLKITKNSLSVEIKDVKSVDLLEKDGSGFVVFKNDVECGGTISVNQAGKISVKITSKNGQYQNGTYNGLRLEGSNKEMVLLVDLNKSSKFLELNANETVKIYPCVFTSDKKSVVTPGSSVESFLTAVSDQNINETKDFGCTYEIAVEFQE